MDEQAEQPAQPAPPADERAGRAVVRGLQGEDGFEVFSDGWGEDARARLRRDYEDSRW